MRRTMSCLSLLLLAGLSVSGFQSIDEEIKVNLVELEVKAQDLSGQFISGLSKNDFVIKENGVHQEIAGFEEVRLDALPKEEAQEYKSRIMIMLDLKNTSYPLMNKVFPEIREYIQTLYDGKSEIGLSLFSNGVLEVISFTDDQEALFDAVDRAETFFTKNKLRSYGKPGSPAPASSSISQAIQAENESRLYRGFLSNYHRYDLDAFGQYIRYLGAYSGKKNLIMVSERLRFSGSFPESDVDQEAVMTLRDIQTVCMYNKIAINVISLARSADYYGGVIGGRAVRSNKGFYLDPGADVAAATSGFFYKTSYRKVDHFVDQTIKKANRYYRIRYYAKSSNPNFRNVKVSLKGLGRIALNLDGYYPRKKKVTHGEANASLVPQKGYRNRLSLDTDWMYASWAGWNKRRASYAVSQKAIDEDGNIVAEQVFTGEIIKKKQGGGYPGASIDEVLTLNIPEKTRLLRVETTIFDLLTGKQLTFIQRASQGKLI